MRVVIDFQGVQAESRRRGIGRYTISLVREMVRQSEGHEILLVLNGRFPESIDEIRKELGASLGQDHIHVWQPPGPVSQIDSANRLRWQAAERLYEAFLGALEPDCVLVTSLFEGIGDDSVTSIKGWQDHYPVAAIFYDLIPLIYPSPYLDNPAHARWYDEKLRMLKKADRLLAISESTREEGLQHLGLPEASIINISSAADPMFRPITVDPERQKVLGIHYGLSRPFIMYTGGIDFRKNVEGLVRAFARLPERLRQSHQLAVVCSIQSTDRERLQTLARQQGLADDSLVLTGFVPEHDLLELYNLCEAFVFPSLHEGFGLPALEAMACGAAVIASNRASLPEVIGLEEALFDPHDDDAITARLAQVIEDRAFQQRLRSHAIQQAARFSWELTAAKTLEVLGEMNQGDSGESLREDNRREASPVSGSEIQDIQEQRPRLAMVAPLPPERSGISDYTAQLLPELAAFYTIDVIVDQPRISDPWIKQHCGIRDAAWLREHAQDYDRVVYQFGNSAFHQHMFDLLEDVPGIVVLHDFFLSGVIAHREWIFGLTNSWTDALYASHGYGAVAERIHEPDAAQIVWRYPCNLPVLQRAQGVIVHSAYSRRLATDWYGKGAGHDWHTIPLLRRPADTGGEHRQQARQALGIKQETLLVCSFGFIGPTKLNHRLLEAWLSSSLAEDTNAVLVFVGDNDSGDYGKQLLETIRASGLEQRIRITGWLDEAAYQHYLAAADIGVQLRTRSRGETSAAVLDCMNHAIPTLVNANGSMQDLPSDAVMRIPDAFTDAHLRDALETLYQDPARRHRMGQSAAQLIHQAHAPSHCAQRYHQAIEASHRHARSSVASVTQDLLRVTDVAELDEATGCELAASLDASLPESPRTRQLFLDVTRLAHAGDREQPLTAALLDHWLAKPPAGYRCEPVRLGPEGYFLYAREFSLNRLGCPRDLLPDEPVSARSADLWLGLEMTDSELESAVDEYRHMSLQGVHLGLVGKGQLPGDTLSQLDVFTRLLLPSCSVAVQPRLLVDISELARRDVGTGIQRVVRNILRQWDDDPPAGYRVTPVLALEHRLGYLQAQQVLLAKLGWPPTLLPDEPIEPDAGDLFLGLDLQLNVVPYQRDTYRRWRERGVTTCFVVYDLLCINFPHFFLQGAKEQFARWLAVACESHGLIAISRTVANQLQDRLTRQQGTQADPGGELPSVDWFHLGADLDPRDHLPEEATLPPSPLSYPLPESAHAQPTFLMVGRLEPRKGYQQVLDAFEILWSQGKAYNLVIVGKTGWMVEALVQRLNQHEALGRQLFWLEACSDEELECLYRRCDCLIAASSDEGFGLPLIEAARHGLAVMARDIPIFHEVAGGCASYFSTEDPAGLAESLMEWLNAYALLEHPHSADMPWQTWQASARQLAACLPEPSSHLAINQEPT